MRHGAIAAANRERFATVTGRSARGGLNDRSDIFVRAGSGRHGLARWGLTRARFVPDIIEAFLRQRGSPAPFRHIYQAVVRERTTTRKALWGHLQAARGGRRRFVCGPEGRMLNAPRSTPWDGLV
jgi:hypothetical protein